MKFTLKIWAVVLAGLAPLSQACAWGSEGHEMVGAIADELLVNTEAGRQVRTILGYNLSEAAKWADCIRSIKKEDDFELDHAPSGECKQFAPPAEQDRMENYVERNWSNCASRPPGGCHTEYHFADVDIRRDGYSRQFIGTGPTDIVVAINSAVLVLQGKPPLERISIKDRKEAILLIAHFVGDIHQPLHVGSVYLNEKGELVDPDALPKQAWALSKINRDYHTRGGNSLVFSSGQKLHGVWDSISWNHDKLAPFVARAKAVPPTQAQVDMLAALWASESVKLSRRAFDGLEFSDKGDDHKWRISASDPGAYKTKVDEIQKAQVAKAGARLAELLQQIWPE
ncbi:S1/P1 nuclease [Reyranella sp.]|uniref:S1/P1 nuclease n=1 Tax=Reyranella sp. TaxID=1929291 RepID=UPI0025EA636F|nr:S1/P1 nuclease [Reyranella sp.]